MIVFQISIMYGLKMFHDSQQVNLQRESQKFVYVIDVCIGGSEKMRWWNILENVKY